MGKRGARTHCPGDLRVGVKTAFLGSFWESSGPEQHRAGGGRRPAGPGGMSGRWGLGVPCPTSTVSQVTGPSGPP